MTKRTSSRRSSSRQRSSEQAGSRPKKRVNRGQASDTSRKEEPSASRPFAPGYGIVGPKGGNGLLPWIWVARKLGKCRTFWLATVYAGQSRPHVMPVWGVWVDDAFFFSTGKTSRKGQNLVANPSCTVTNDDGEEAVIVEGAAKPIEDKDVLERVAADYKKKYRMDPRGMNEPIFELRPTKVFAFIEKSFPKSATRWKL
jgi:nitroimidazol reductase NimA-like FMN-containing flavoprotein (pyridoxamine 5'-phosphate oxidase superfamily)